MFKEITLTSGEVVKVYPVPGYAVVAVSAQIAADNPIGDPPTTTIKTMAGEEPWPDTSMDSEAYQAYLRKKRAVEAKQSAAADDLTFLVALRDVPLPQTDDWFAPFKFAGLTLSTDPDAKRLDYLRYCLLADARDMKIFQSTVNELSWPREERVAALKQSFPDNHSEPAAGAMAGTNSLEG